MVAEIPMKRYTPPVVDKHFRAAAFFDIDKTLLPGVSAEMLFLRSLLRGKIPGRFRVLPFIAEAIRLVPNGLTVARKANKAYLAGAAPDEVRSWAEQLFASQILPRLGGRGSAWIDHERSQMRAIVLLSGMPSLLIDPFTRHFSADLSVGTVMEVNDRGKLTGRRSGPHPYGPAKLEIARQLATEHGWKLPDCSAYGDHASDAFLLGSVGEAYAVAPDRLLRMEATRHGWTILEADSD